MALIEVQSYSPSLCLEWNRITLVILVSVQFAIVCDWKGAMKEASPWMPIVFNQPLEALNSGAGLGLQEVFGMAEEAIWLQYPSYCLERVFPTRAQGKMQLSVAAFW